MWLPPFPTHHSFSHLDEARLFVEIFRRASRNLDKAGLQPANNMKNVIIPFGGTPTGKERKKAVIPEPIISVPEAASELTFTSDTQLEQ